MYRTKRYLTPLGVEPVTQWLESLPDPDARRAVLDNLEAVSARRPAICRELGRGLIEAELECGPGVRLYYAPIKDELLLLLCGVGPRTRAMERDTAKRFLEDHLARAGLVRDGMAA